MKVSLTHCPWRASRRLPAAAAAFLFAFTVGCASPGPPQPPSLKLPETVKDLTAARVGNSVQLRWTTPSTTTDHLVIKGPITAELCRINVPATPSACVPVARMPVTPGPTKAEDALPPTLTVDPATLLAYRVQLFNSHGRSAGLSPEAFAASGAAPPSVDQLHATPTPDGAMLQWQQKDTAAVVELDRLPVDSNGVVAEPAPPKSTSKSPKSTAKKSTIPRKSAQVSAPKPVQKASPAPTEVKLRTPAQATAAGGTIDRTALKDDTYRYTAQRVRSVSLGRHQLELRSVPSSPVTVLMHNLFPPHAPTGLEAIPGGATAADRAIDLSWTPNTDTELAGYIVYRQEIDSKGVVAATATRLNATPVVGPAYRDQTATTGRRYAYHVTAVDTAGNESAASDSVQETLREQ